MLSCFIGMTYLKYDDEEITDINFFTTLSFTALAQEYIITKFGVSADSTKLNTKTIQGIIG